MKKFKLLKLITFIVMIILISVVAFNSRSDVVEAINSDYFEIQDKSGMGITVKEGKGYYNATGDTVYFKFFAESYYKQTIYVKYHTENLTAIEGIDFTGTSSSVSIDLRTYNSSKSKFEGYINIAINVKQSKFNIKIENQYFSKSFALLIDQITSSEGRTFDYNTNICEIKLESQYTFETSYRANKGFVLKQYDQIMSYSDYWGDVENDETRQTGAVCTYDMYNYDDVRESGLAEVYVTGGFTAPPSENSKEEGTRFIIGDRDWAAGRSCSYYAIGSLMLIEAGRYGVYFDLTSVGRAAKQALHISNEFDDNYLMSAAVSGSVSNGDVFFDDNIVWLKNEGELGCGASVYKHYARDEDGPVSIIVEQALFDRKIPEVENIYLDKYSFDSRGILRITVEFSEPIYSQYIYDTKLFAETNNSQVSLEFKYAGGIGTQCLYYEWDINDSDNAKLVSNKNINKIRFNNSIGTGTTYVGNSFHNFRLINDFGLNYIDRINSSAGKEFSVSIDRRVPSIEVDEYNKSSSIPVKSPSVLVSLEKVTKGTLYYQWVPIVEGNLDSRVLEKEVNTFDTFEHANLYINRLKSECNAGKVEVNSGYYAFGGKLEINNKNNEDFMHVQIPFSDLTQSANYYLICYCEPPFKIGAEKDIKVYQYGTYFVDNDEPEYTSLVARINQDSTDPGISRIISFDAFDNSLMIDHVYVEVRERKENAKVFKKELFGVQNPLDLEKTTYTYSLKLQNLIDSYYTDDDGRILVNKDSGTYEVRFTIVDKAQNYTYVYPDFQSFYISTLNSFTPEIESETHRYDNPSNLVVFDELDTVIIFKADSTDIVNNVPFNISINNESFTNFVNQIDPETGNPILGNYMSTSSYYLYTSEAPYGDEGEYLNKLVIKEPGYYTVKLERVGQYSDVFTFYVTNGFNDITENYENINKNKLVLSNVVYQLSEDISFTFVNAEGNVEKEYYGGAVAPTFSSRGACLNFLKFYEYLDLKLVEIDSNIASYLNNSSGSDYYKAPGETQTAQSGQVWIRYKIPTWDTNSYAINYWGYYYYSPRNIDKAININKLPDNLQNAIDTVINKIAREDGLFPNAKSVYLVGDEGVETGTGAPFLTQKQKDLAEAITFESSKTGTKLINAFYGGDPNLYKSSVKVNGENLPLASNYKIISNDVSRFFYKSSNGDSFTPLFIKQGMTLRDAINESGNVIISSGIYTIRELNVDGGSEFRVYIDNSCPNITYQYGEDAIIEDHDDNVSNIHTSKFAITGVGTNNEVDDYSYVAVFTYPQMVLQKFIKRGTVDEFNPYELEEGIYQLYIGDRSGNIFSFKAFIANKNPEIEFKKNDESIRININNRIEEEIRQFSVYLNDVLIDDTLTLSKGPYTKNGIYRVVIKDVYSDVEHEYSETFERKQPDITFYYYDGYDFTRSDISMYMAMEQGDKYINVSTSKRLKVKFNPEICTFSVTGLPLSSTEGYTYHSKTGELEFNVLSGCYLSVWEIEHPESVYTYKISIDCFAPSIRVNADNVLLVYDETNEENYGEDKTHPNSIKYNFGHNTSTDEIAFREIVNNDFVSVSLNDETGIGSVKVYLNDKLVQEHSRDEINGKNFEFFIGNKEGNVKIVATDYFQNSTSFEFSFNKKQISVLNIDGREVDSSFDDIYFGNSDLVYKALSGTTVFIRVFYDGKDQYLIFRNLEGKLYTGIFTTSEGTSLETGDEITRYGIVDFFNGGILDEEGKNNDKPVDLDENGEYYPIDGLDLVVIPNEKGEIVVKYYPNEESVSFVFRTTKGNVNADYYTCSLSTQDPSIKFINNDTDEEFQINDDNYIFGSSTNVSIEYEGLVEGLGVNKILKENIKVAFNKLGIDFDEEDFIYSIDNCFENGEGYYCFRVNNVYKKSCEYYYIYTENISASIELSYIDKAKEMYSIYHNDGYFYTNSSACISGYNLKLLKATDDKSGELLETISEKDVLKVNIDKTSTIQIEDIYGNSFVVHVEVGTDEEFKFNEDWISGYPEKANKAGGYTKDVLSINLNEDSLISSKISQIIIFDGENQKVLFGYDGLESISYSADNFVNSIGICDNGETYIGTKEYVVMFANKYGDVARKTIKFSSVPSLIIRRQTTSSVDLEEISVEDAINKGVWSNRSITFSSTLDNNYYSFYKIVEGQENAKLVLDYSFVLSSTSQNGRIDYKVNYYDDYGYEYEGIEVHLYRADINLRYINMDFITIDKKLYTNDIVQISFDEKYEALYYFNDSEEANVYLPGQKLYRDGNYVFQIRDESGNEAIASFIKDTVVDFKISSSNGIDAFNGGVINASSLVFRQLNGDNCFIKHVRLDGENLTPQEEMVFNKTGHYELIIGDEVGNSTMFEFYLLNHSVCDFSYFAPTGYTINEVYRTNNDIRVTYLSAIIENDELLLNEEGTYDIVLKDNYRDSTLNFSVVIDQTAPTAELVGVDDQGTTTKDISLKNVESSDIIKVYRNGELIHTYGSETEEFKMITEGGKYKIKVTNLQGVTKEFSFIKKNIANAPLSMLIIVLCIISAGGFFIGLLFRNRSKFDE